MERAQIQRVAGAGLGFVLAFLLVTALLPRRQADAGLSAPDRVGGGAAPTEDVALQAPQQPVEAPTPVPVAPPAPEPTEPSPAAVAATGADASPLGTVLHGLVTDVAGEPQEEAWVTVQLSDGSRVDTQSDESGRYTLGPFAPGDWSVKASKRFYHEESAALTLVRSEPLLRQDFALRPKQVIWVRLVTSAGTPALEALNEAGTRTFRLNLVPVATREDPGATFTGVRGSLNNKFGIGSFWQDARWEFQETRGAPYYGTVTLHEDGPAWLSLVAAHQVLGKQRVDPSTEEVTFVLDPDDVLALQCGLRATLVDADSGAPLAGRAWLGGDPFPAGQANEVGDDGQVRLEDVLPGERWFYVRAEGRASHVQRVSLAPGQVLELGEVPLHPPVTLSGHVRTADGDPVEAVLRWGELEPGGGVAWARQIQARSEPDGSFSIGNLTPGLWVLRCPGLPSRPPYPPDANLMSLPVRVDATQGSVEGIEVVLHATTPVTLVTADVAEPWPHATVLDAAGLPVTTAWPGRYRDETVVHVVPGSYDLVIERDGFQIWRSALVVGDEAQRLELALD